MWVNLPISGKIDSTRSTEVRKHNDPLPLNFHDDLFRCLVNPFCSQLGANEETEDNDGRPKLDGGDVGNCCDDDATASPLSSEIGIIILIFTR